MNCTFAERLSGLKHYRQTTVPTFDSALDCLLCRHRPEYSTTRNDFGTDHLLIDHLKLIRKKRGKSHSFGAFIVTNERQSATNLSIILLFKFEDR